MSLAIKSADTWKSPLAVHIKDSGAWKQAKGVWIKSAGSWEQAFSTITKDSLSTGTTTVTTTRGATSTLGDEDIAYTGVLGVYFKQRTGASTIAGASFLDSGGIQLDGLATLEVQVDGSAFYTFTFRADPYGGSSYNRYGDTPQAPFTFANATYPDGTVIQVEVKA